MLCIRVPMLVAAGVTLSMSAFADPNETAAEVDPAPIKEAVPGVAQSSSGVSVAASSNHSLNRIHGGLAADGANKAGTSRDVQMGPGRDAVASKVARPIPTPRILRKMAPERLIASVDPSIRACSSENGLPAPVTFGLRVSVTPTGDIEGIELASTTRVAPPLLSCAVRAFTAARFGAPGGAGASIVVPITVPARTAGVAAAGGATPVAPVAAPAAVTPPAPTEPKPQEVAANKS